MITYHNISEKIKAREHIYDVLLINLDMIILSIIYSPL